MTTRIYEVMDVATGTVDDDGAEHPRLGRLVEATSSAQAVRHVVSKRYATSIPNTKRVAELLGRGVTVEKAAAE